MSIEECFPIRQPWDPMELSIVWPGGNVIVAIRNDGTFKWEASSGLNWETSLLLGRDDTVYVNGGTQASFFVPSSSPDNAKLFLTAVRPDGSLRWKFKYPWPYQWLRKSTVPAIGPTGSIYLGDFSLFAQAGAFALDENGGIQWEFPINSSTGVFDVAVGADGSVYVVAQSGQGSYGVFLNTLFALRADGTSGWNFGSSSDYTIAGFRSTAVGPDGNVHFAASMARVPGTNSINLSGDYVFSMNLEGGVKWTYQSETNISAPLIIDAEGGVYFVGSDKRLHALDASGRKKWNFQADSDIVTAPAVAANGDVYFVTQSTHLYAVRPDGTTNWTHKVGSAVELPPVIGGDGVIYLLSGNKLIAIAGGSPPSSRGWPMFRGDARHSGGNPRTFGVPPSPTGVSASRGGYGVKLAWNSVPVAAAYEVWRSARNELASAMAVATNIGGKLNYRDIPPLFGGAHYYYWVRARNISGLSEMGTGLMGSSRPVAPGDLLWEMVLETTIRTVPAVGKDGVIFVQIGDYFVEAQANYSYAIRPDGTILSKNASGFSPPNEIALDRSGSSPTFSGPVAVNADGQVVDVRLSIWNVDGPRYPPAAIGPDATVYISAGTNLYACNPEGHRQWISAASLTNGTRPIVGTEGTIYILSGTKSETLYAIDRLGRTKWSFSGGGGVASIPVAAVDGTVYVGANTHIFALNPNGSVKWAFPQGGDLNSESLFIPGNSSLALGSDGTLHVASYTNLFALDPNGRNLWTFAIPERLTTSPTISSDGVLYIGAGAKLYAIKVGTGPLVHPWPMFDHDPQHTNRALQCGFRNPGTAADGQFVTTLALELLRNYVVEESVDLLRWQALTNFTATNTSPRFVQPISKNSAVKFYRLVSP